MIIYIFNKYYYIIIIIIIIIFYNIELDRNFSGKPYQFYSYYIQTFPLPILGLYNTLIRTFNPHHTHIFNPDMFISHHIIKKHWKIIQNEALNIYSKKNKLHNMRDIGVMNNFDTIDKENDQWKVFILKWYNNSLEIAKRNCPNTVCILDKCTDVHAAMFSILEPGKYIPPHKGPSTACLRYHLGLKIPNDINNCYIKVNSQKYNWSEGSALVFDDTYVHSVYNNTNEPRIILFIDIERPLSSPLKELNKIMCTVGKFTEFVKGVNDVAEKTRELFHN